VQGFIQDKLLLNGRRQSNHRSHPECQSSIIQSGLQCRSLVSDVIEERHCPGLKAVALFMAMLDILKQRR
jgi:hypothetical protein